VATCHRAQHDERIRHCSNLILCTRIVPYPSNQPAAQIFSFRSAYVDRVSLYLNSTALVQVEPVSEFGAGGGCTTSNVAHAGLPSPVEARASLARVRFSMLESEPSGRTTRYMFG
jgi:hypothetical protein